jgi:hypothetical protein
VPVLDVNELCNFWHNHNDLVAECVDSSQDDYDTLKAAWSSIPAADRQNYVSKAAGFKKNPAQYYRTILVFVNNWLSAHPQPRTIPHQQ